MFYKQSLEKSDNYERYHRWAWR